MSWELEKFERYLIYGIVDPITGLYVYIGSTRVRLWDRQMGHSAGHGNRPLSLWLKNEKTNGRKVKFVIVHRCNPDVEDLHYWEYFYIKKYKTENHPLFNKTFKEIKQP